MTYHFSLERCFDTAIGERGMARMTWERVLQDAKKTVAQLKQQREEESLPLLTIGSRRDDLAMFRSIAERIREQFTDVVVLGTGGSTLNPQAVTNLHADTQDAPKLHFLDNIDPITMEGLLHSLNLKKTAFLAISKSGSTLETLTQTLIALDVQRHVVGKSINKHWFFITDPGKNVLRDIAESIGGTISDHEPAIGGRFSSLTNVGLLPLLIRGGDALACREGSIEVVEQVMQCGIESAPVASAAADIVLMQRGFPIKVMMPYVDQLSGFATWYRQTWAESLGKQGVHTSIIKAMGTLDQHSQLQLYLGGQHDKAFTILSLDTTGKGPNITLGELPPHPGLTYLEGKTLGDVLEAEQKATTDTFTRNGCPVKTIRLKELNDYTMGALLMHSMLEIIIIAGLLRINAFDQPAVEEGKILARELLQGKAQPAVA
ncbi:MAG: pgi [Rickettsiales bacterium]|jgi:glucose-6-phosphate isomerase|nr:pgi [Rickettsiales bacterium]